MMRKRIGKWMLVLGSLLAPATGNAQELRQWYASPMEWIAPAQGETPSWLTPAAPLPYIARGQVGGAEQAYTVPPVLFTGPLSHPRYEEGGFYSGIEFLYWRQTRPILSQTVAIRGFVDTNGNFGPVGGFVGNRQEALNTNMVQGSGTFQPGLNAFLGYRFHNGVSVDLEWIHLAEARYAAVAGVLPGNFNLGSQGQNTFLFSPVFNFPVTFAGNNANVLVNGVAANGATFGIWNAASDMQIQFIQRYEQIQLNSRIPVWETDCYRAYGIFGPRALIMWEKFEWRTVDRDVFGRAVADTIANYNNIVSNRLYGVYVGSGHEWYCGSTPVGAFSVDLSVSGALYLDFVKGRARYELGDKSEAATRSRRLSELSPGVDGKIGIMWYPWEAIQIRLGYSFLAVFNTVASPRPIDFNFGTIDPAFEGWSNRLLHGIDVGIAFVF
jgi:hypothetical protein